MIRDILESKYKSLIFKYSLNDLEDKNKLTLILKNELLTSYSYEMLLSMLSSEEKVFYRLVKVNYNQNTLESEVFFIFCRVYLEFILNKQKKETERAKNSSSGGVASVEVNTKLGLQEEKEVKVDRKSIYGDKDDDSEDPVVMTYKRDEYLRKIKKETHLDSIPPINIEQQLNQPQLTPSMHNVQSQQVQPTQTNIAPPLNAGNNEQPLQAQSNVQPINIDDYLQMNESSVQNGVNLGEQVNDYSQTTPQTNYNELDGLIDDVLATTSVTQNDGAVQNESKKKNPFNIKIGSKKKGKTKELQMPQKKTSKHKGISANLKKSMKG